MSATANRKLPSLADLERFKREDRRKRAVPLSEVLAAKGVSPTIAGIYGFLSNYPGKKHQSNYDILVHEFGDDAAMKIMRQIEVAEWDLPVLEGASR